ncbi:hypothetical protein FO675_10520 [Riemerella anatipestifer]|uniref:hypothetical protein n=1 Tax=Riemerella anatipestifer TaxID=34085 RepID=UPI001AD7A2BD|nr:hypothetical protein [Riemerella anatipestifer]MBO4234717.1 hypothetical protein [Riemerella anatipestifer]
MKQIIFISLTMILFSCKEKTVTLISHDDTSVKYVFKYTTDGIMESKVTNYQGKIYVNKTYYHWRGDGYYEYIDNLNKDTLQNFKKVLSLNDVEYTYENPFIASLDIVNKVSIDRVGVNQYRYKRERGTSYRQEIFFDKNYKIYKLVERVNKDSVVWLYQSQ